MQEIGPIFHFCLAFAPPLGAAYVQVVYWSIHTKEESKRRTTFAFIFGVNWPWCCGVLYHFNQTKPKFEQWTPHLNLSKNHFFSPMHVGKELDQVPEEEQVILETPFNSKLALHVKVTVAPSKYSVVPPIWPFTNVPGLGQDMPLPETTQYSTSKKWRDAPIFTIDFIIVVIITWTTEKPSQKNDSDITVI